MGLLFLCVVVASVALTWTYLGMRAVMDIGGACAEGGPYVPVQPCPDGTWMLALAIPTLIIVSMLGSGIAVTLAAPDLLIPMWGLLFGSLGWNFLDYGLFSGDLVWGWIICGVVFELMALPVLLLPISSLRGRTSWKPPTPSAPDRATVSLPWWPIYTALAATGAVLGTLSFRAWS